MSIKTYAFALITFIISTYALKAQTSSWVGLGSSTNSLNCPAGLYDLVGDNAGNMYAGGSLFDANYSGYVAKWSGSAWGSLGSSFSSTQALGINALCKSPSGKIYAAGSAMGAAHVMEWTGLAWNDLCVNSNPATGSSFYTALCSDAAGNIYATGSFTNASGKLYVAKWNGFSWAETGSNASFLNANGSIKTLYSNTSGNVYAAGYFKNSNGKYYVAKWNGSTWSELGTGANALNANGPIYSVTGDNAGNIYAGGAFSNDSSYGYVAKWNGTSWSELGTLQNRLKANNGIYSVLCGSNGIIYAGGSFMDSSYTNYYVAAWNGTSWSNFGNLHADNAITKLCTDAAGNIYAACVILDGNVTYNVAKYGNTTVSIPELSADKISATVFPNPCNAKVYVSSEATLLQVTITDQLGRSIYNEKLNSSNNTTHEINTAAFEAGLYIITLSDGQNISSKKLLIER